MTRTGIVLAGTVILDIVNIIDHWPAEETAVLISRTEYGAGGPPHNAAAGLKKLGAPFPVKLLGAVGDDEYGTILIAQAAGYGLDTSGIRRMPDSITSHTQVMSSAATGRRTFFHQTGVSGQLTPEMLAPTGTDAKIFYVGSPGIAKTMDHTGGWQEILKKAKSQGCLTALEMVPVSRHLQQAHVVPCMSLTDILVINDGEAEDITGIKVSHSQRLHWHEAERACARLFEMGVGRMAAIHHPDGAVGMTRQGEVARAGSVNVLQSEIVGSVGAGDAFYAGVLFGLHEDWSLQRCLELGNAAAATSLHSATTSASIRPYTECLDYAAKCGVRDAQ